MRRVTLEVPEQCGIAVFETAHGEHGAGDAKAEGTPLINDLARQLHVATGAELRMVQWVSVVFGHAPMVMRVIPPPPLVRPTNPT